METANTWLRVSPANAPAAVLYVTYPDLSKTPISQITAEQWHGKFEMPLSMALTWFYEQKFTVTQYVDKLRATRMFWVDKGISMAVGRGFVECEVYDKIIDFRDFSAKVTMVDMSYVAGWIINSAEPAIASRTLTHYEDVEQGEPEGWVISMMFKSCEVLFDIPCNGMMNVVSNELEEDL